MRSIKEKLASSGTILLLRIVAMATKFALTIYIAAHIGIATVGTYGIIVGIAAVAPSLVRMGLMGVICRASVSDDIDSTIRNVRMYSVVVSTIYLFALVAAALSFIINGDIIAVLVVIVTINEHVNQDIYRLFVSLGKPKTGTLSLSLSGSIWPMAYMVSAITFPQLRGLDSILLFWCASALPTLLIPNTPARFLFSTVPLGASWRTTIEWYKSLIPQSSKFFVSNVSSNIIYYSDRYILLAFSDIETVGVYVFYWQFSSAIYNLANAGAIQIYTPQHVARFDRGDIMGFGEAFKACMTWSIVEISALAFGALLVLPWMLRASQSPDVLLESIGLLQVLLAAQGIRIVADVLGLRLTSARLDVRMAKSDLLALSSMLISCTAGSAVAGPYGAAAAGVIAYSMVCAYRWPTKSRNTPRWPAKNNMK